uniref:Uncharacterized protein n=1 Tax=Anopheles atroparvus TaxID=41427 RepID=A0A182IKJ6_ANOAO
MMSYVTRIVAPTRASLMRNQIHYVSGAIPSRAGYQSLSAFGGGGGGAMESWQQKFFKFMLMLMQGCGCLVGSVNGFHHILVDAAPSASASDRHSAKYTLLHFH